jgi:hypothetical protein
MRKPWRTVAELADTPAFTVEEVVPEMLNALSNDWREEVSAELQRELKTLLGHADQFRLFPEQRRQALDRLARTAAGMPLALALVECADRVMAAGRAGEDAFTETVRSALALRVTRGTRQTEEHYLRKTAAPRANNVRARFEQAANACDFATLARRLTGAERGPTIIRAGKKDGLDDGVPL